MPSSHLRHSLDDPTSRARQIARSFRRNPSSPNLTLTLPTKRLHPDHPHPESQVRSVIRRTESSSSMSDSPGTELGPVLSSPPSPCAAPSAFMSSPSTRGNPDDPEANLADARFMQSQTHEHVIVPAEHVGIIIGKHGDTIKAIQNTSGAVVSMDRDYPSRDRKFRISGTESAVAHCRTLIQRRLDAARDRFGSSSETREMWIPISKIGLVIGVGGVTIRSIKEKTGAYVTVHNNEVQGGRKLLTIHGTMPQTSHARQLIIDILQNAPPTPPREMPADIYHDTTAIYIPRAAVGSVIGSRGTTLRLLHQKSGAIIKVASDEEAGDSAERQIIIAGTTASIDRARSMIQYVIREGSLREYDNTRAESPHQRRDGVLPIDSVSRLLDIRRRALAQGRKEDSFVLSADHIGLLIGKNGANIREMQNRSGAIIEVTGKNEAERDGSHRTVSIFGSPTEVKIAKILIEEKTGLQHDVNETAEEKAVLRPHDHNARSKRKCRLLHDKDVSFSASEDQPQSNKGEAGKENMPLTGTENDSSLHSKPQRASKNLKSSTNKKRGNDATESGGLQTEDSQANTAVESTGASSKRNNRDSNLPRNGSTQPCNSASKSTDIQKKPGKNMSQVQNSGQLAPCSVHAPPSHAFPTPFVPHGQYQPPYPPTPYYGEPSVGGYPFFPHSSAHAAYHQPMAPLSTPIATNGNGGGSPRVASCVAGQPNEATSAITTENSKIDGDKAAQGSSAMHKAGGFLTHVPGQFYPTCYPQPHPGPMMYPPAGSLYGGYVYNQLPTQFRATPNDFTTSKGFNLVQREGCTHPFSVPTGPRLPVHQHGSSMTGNNG
ncbi:Far upstream element-binding protein 3 [Gracilariopsis chorda]|uniref:Far upstream element-binding protein 3 n=1 Tax=Gracilariopsis chorda TaxID=448386 RepID=A0A2V3IMC0_9FLOR|nr:Far upstream element-binding protein 3 [Gracilariopsis chorda]|eukprot:PXF43197.1 Far upstream element-binding protein 3 [Gracilariopsis chorda]